MFAVFHRKLIIVGIAVLSPNIKCHQIRKFFDCFECWTDVPGWSVVPAGIIDCRAYRTATTHREQKP